MRQPKHQWKCIKLSTARQLLRQSQSWALIYNLTWIEFILLRVDDQGRAGWRGEGELSNLIFDTEPRSATVFDLSLFLFFPLLFFCSIFLKHRNTIHRSFLPDTLHFVYTLTNTCIKQLGEEQITRQTSVIFDVIKDIHAPRMNPESFLIRLGFIWDLYYVW